MRILMHIGCAKGGSSAIQRFLRENVDAIAGQGITVATDDLVPGSAVSGNQIELFQTLAHQERPIEDWGQRCDALAASGVETLLVSAENLCNPFGLGTALASVADRHDVSVLMYVRRQDDYLESAWQQWYVKDGESLMSWLLREVGVLADWEAYLQQWVDGFGVDAITVRRYERSAFPDGDVCSDYAEWAGIDRSDMRSPRNANPSLNASVSRFVEGHPEFFVDQHDHRFYRFLQLHGGPGVEKGSGAPLFTLAERQGIMRHYADANERLRQRFLPDHDGPLFAEPAASPAGASDSAEESPTHVLQHQLWSLYRELRRNDVVR